MERIPDLEGISAEKTPLGDRVGRLLVEYREPLPFTKGTHASVLLMIFDTVAKLRRGHIAKLEARIAALEAQRVRYCGGWREDGDYGPGDIVTDKGALWHCWAATRARPGTSESWQLMAKTGR